MKFLLLVAATLLVSSQSFASLGGCFSVTPKVGTYSVICVQHVHSGIGFNRSDDYRMYFGAMDDGKMHAAEFLDGKMNMSTRGEGKLLPAVAFYAPRSGYYAQETPKVLFALQFAPGTSVLTSSNGQKYALVSLNQSTGQFGEEAMLVEEPAQ